MPDSDPSENLDTDERSGIPTSAAGERADERWLTPGVLGVGGASLFSDTGHELVTSILPTFLVSTLH